MNENYHPQTGSAAIGINSPDLSDSGEIRQRAVTDGAQAWQIISALERENDERNIKNARIASKYNAERPYSAEKLRSEGLSWRSNFSSKPLGTLIDKVAPRFTKAVKGVRYLTSAKLPDLHPGAAFKTEYFRRQITDTIRAREGWDDLVSDIAVENALYGFTACAWLDETSWFPASYRQDAFYVPQNTRQSAKYCQVVVLRDVFMVHELFEFIKDQDAAESAGWNVDATIRAINNAMPEGLRSGMSETYRIYQDLIRGCSLGAAYTGAKTIVVYSLLATEADGQVSHFMLNEADTHEVLFEKEDRFKSMDKAVCFFAFQKANGKLHGSKGIGREVYAMASVLDRARNEVVDRLQLSGKLLFTTEEKNINRFKMSVVGNAILVGQNYAPQQMKVDGGVEAFFALDNFLSGLLDQIAGSTSPKVFESERTTRAAVELYAAREEERADVVIERFVDQFAKMMTTIQSRLCDPGTREEDAKELQERLKVHLTEEEIQMLADQPAVSTVSDYSERERQQVVQAVLEARGNPLYNQREIEARKLTAQLGAEFAEAVLLPQNDPTEQAEQARQQQLELLALVEGQPVPISPRDNHLVHMSVLQGPIQAAAQSAVEDPGAVNQMEVIVAHAQEHLAAAEAAGVDGKVLEPFYNMIFGSVDAIARLRQQEAELAQMGMDPNGNPLDPAAPAGPGGFPPGIAEPQPGAAVAPV